MRNVACGRLVAAPEIQGPALARSLWKLAARILEVGPNELAAKLVREIAIVNPLLGIGGGLQALGTWHRRQRWRWQR